MSEIARFRSLWGIEPGQQLENWKTKFPLLKEKGYDGIEVDLYVLKHEDDYTRLKALCKEVGFKISAFTFSSWPQYVGPRPLGLTPQDHLETYRQQIEYAIKLDAVNINIQSGCDVWSLDQSIEFFRGTLEIDAELGVVGKVKHETHRNRSLYTPQATDYILQHVPQLRITTDISHWVVVSERLLNANEEDLAILDRVIPHVGHVHARMGTTQASQCPEPLHPAFAEERAFFEWYWARVVDYHFTHSDAKESLAFVPEYGPFPYHPIGSKRTFEEVADEEGVRLHSLFDGVVAKVRK